MMRKLLPLALLGLLLAMAPSALAQEEKPEDNATRPDDAAWVEDCPPDMMCAYAGGEGEPRPYGNESCIECSGPSDGAIGPDDCRDCMTPPGETCMDGASENETCRDDVQYLDGRGPADCEYCRGEATTPPADAESHSGTVESKSADVPAPAIALVILGVALVALLALPRRG